MSPTNRRLAAAAHRPGRPGFASVAIGAVIVLVAGACSSKSATTAGSTSDPAAAAAAALDASGSTEVTVNAPTTAPATPTSSTVVGHSSGEPAQPLDPTSIPGAIINQYTLAVGDCYDQIRDLRNGLPVVVTTKLACDTPHEFEVYSRLTFPAGFPALYPGDKVIRDFALQSCYRRFESWVGTKYETSVLDIEVLIPNQTNFEDPVARYRGIHCSVHRSDGELLTATTRGSGL